LNVKENPNHPICIRNAKKETKKNANHLICIKK